MTAGTVDGRPNVVSRELRLAGRCEPDDTTVGGDAGVEGEPSVGSWGLERLKRKRVTAPAAAGADAGAPRDQRPHPVAEGGQTVCVAKGRRYEADGNRRAQKVYLA